MKPNIAIKRVGALQPTILKHRSRRMTEARKPRARTPRVKLRTEQKQGEKEKLDRHWRGLFLDMLAETFNVSASAKAAGVTTSRAYKVRRCEPDFARRWNEALLKGYEHLEMETLHRLRAGTGKDDPKYDTANALRLLAMHKENAAKEKARQEEMDEDAILASIDAKIDAMRARESEMAEMLAAEETKGNG
jgi:hypothetical protein